MEASPRDNEETVVDGRRAGRGHRAGAGRGRTGTTAAAETGEAGETGGAGGAGEAHRSAPSYGETPYEALLGRHEDMLGHPEDDDSDDEGDEPADSGASRPDAGAPVEAQELRPQPKLRLWQLAPIVGLGALGSLMFAFPLAFEPGGGTGAVVAMLGLLLCGCAAGWGVMAARRVGHTWPGLHPRGTARRQDWRIVVLYAGVVGTLVALAVWRVARLAH